MGNIIFINILSRAILSFTLEYVKNLLGNTHVRIKIYRQKYHGIIETANEGRHVRIQLK